MATAIEFNNISKIYRLGLVSTGTLAHDMKRWWTMNVRGKEDPYLTIGETNDRSTKGDSDYVWALKDIDFKVEQGDVVGIIGKNGAGKSTLLKILSKVTAPTTGTIRARGRIGSLLEVGTGFHPEMTGRENIYMNGAILGMTKQEISKKLDEIIDFSGCERYIDTPVKRYSSGMMVRLGFAVAAHLDPEILVVDEVLAVGDAEFQKKAIGKMQDVSKGEGRTVLFVSHNMDAVTTLCKKGILLSNGHIEYMDNAANTVNAYLSKSTILPSFYQEESKYSIFIKEVFFNGSHLNHNGQFCFSENINISIKLQNNLDFGRDSQSPVISVCIMTTGNTRVCTDEIELKDFLGKKEIIINLIYPSRLILPGKYHFRIDIHIPNRELFDGQDVCDFTILDDENVYSKYNGQFNGFIKASPQICVQK